MRLNLNLLPPAKKKALKSNLLMAYAQTMVLLVFLATLFISAILVSVRMMLAADYNDLKKKSASAGTKESVVVTNEIKLINSYLRQLATRQASFIAWSDVVKSISTMIPAHTRLESINIGEKYDITMSGEAETREEALELLNKLKSADFLTDVSSPLSNLLQKRDVEFDFEMKYQKK